MVRELLRIKADENGLGAWGRKLVATRCQHARTSFFASSALEAKKVQHTILDVEISGSGTIKMDRQFQLQYTCT